MHTIEHLTNVLYAIIGILYLICIPLSYAVWKYVGKPDTMGNRFLSWMSFWIISPFSLVKYLINRNK